MLKLWQKLLLPFGFNYRTIAVYEVLGKLPRHGVGSRIQRKTWLEDSFWDIAEVRVDVSGKTGKAYGMLTWRGEQVHEKPIRIPGTLKKVWRPMTTPEEMRPNWTPLDTTLMASVAEKDSEKVVEQPDATEQSTP